MEYLSGMLIILFNRWIARSGSIVRSGSRWRSICCIDGEWQRGKVETFLTLHSSLPSALRSKVAEYFEHRFHGKMFDEDALLDQLNTPLRNAVLSCTSRELIKAVPFFNFSEPNFLALITQRLHYEYFQPGDVIARQGTIGDRLYFIQDGVVEVYGEGEHANYEAITCLSDGSYFGERCLVGRAKRTASVRAQTFVSTYSLHFADFQLAAAQYPRIHKVIEEVFMQGMAGEEFDPSMYMKDSLEELEEDSRKHTEKQSSLRFK